MKKKMNLVTPNDKKYLIVTPCKNEEKYIPKLITSVLKQDIKPKLWIFMNDGSTDNTLKLMKSAAKNNNWIKVITLPPGKRDLRLRYSFVCREGFRKAIDIAKKKHIIWDYIALMDADVMLSKDHMSKLMEYLESNPQLGIVSGSLFIENKGKLEKEKVPEYFPHGPVRMWNKKCFFETDMYKITYCPDGVSCAIAIMNGWKTRNLPEPTGIHRKTSSANGLWKGYIINGEGYYYVNYNPLHVILKGIQLSFRRPFYLGLAFCIGYFSKFIRRDQQIEDKKIRDYYYITRFKEKLCGKNV